MSNNCILISLQLKGKINIKKTLNSKKKINKFQI